MTPNEQGAFCGKCVKTVVDFSNKSLDEIKAFFTGREQEKVCGRFEEKQLTALSFDAFFEKFRRFEFTKRFAVILYFTFGVWLFGTSAASAQSNEHVKGDVMVEERTELGNVKVESTGNEKINCIKPNPNPQPAVVGAVSPTTQSQTYKMGKVVPVKQAPVKDPGKQPRPGATVKQKPMKMGEVSAPPPKEKAAPKQ